MAWFNSKQQQQKFLVLYIVIAGLSFFTTLFLPHVGEEAVYTLGAMEMLHNHQYLMHTLLNTSYGRPPLLIWFIALLTKILGWQDVLLASRLVTVVASLLTAVVLYYFVRRLSKNQIIALLSVAIFFTGDLLFRRGWLAYADPLFSFFIFSAIACLWLSVEEKRYSLLLLAVLATACAFLTKALTVYIFYGVAGLVLLWRHPNRWFLLSPISIILNLCAIAWPIIWLTAINPGDMGMVNDILLTAGTSATLLQHISHIIVQPFRLMGLLAPISLVVIYLAIRKRIDYNLLPKQLMIILLLIIAINYLPYWIAIKGKDPRYIEPLYPLCAFALGYFVYAAKQSGIKLSCYWLLVAMVLKLVAGFWGFYYYQNHYRSHYRTLAKQVLHDAHGQALYSRDVQFTGLSAAANIDMIWNNEKLISMPPKDLRNGYIIAAAPNQPGDKVYKHYAVKRTDVYLLCKGKAC